MKRGDRLKLCAELRQILPKRFDKDELRDLCFDLGVVYEDLPGKGRKGKARELVAYCERRERIAELIAVGKEQRPDVPWPEIPGVLRDVEVELAQLRQFILDHYNLSEFEQLCLNMHVSYDDLNDQPFTDKVWELILRMGQQMRFSRLLFELRRVHSDSLDRVGFGPDEVMLDALYAELPSVLSVTRRKEFFDLYWNQRLLDEQVRDGLLTLAAHVVRREDEQLSKDLISDDYSLSMAAPMLRHAVWPASRVDLGQARGELITLEEKERRYDQRRVILVTAISTEFLEYMMARSLVRDWDRADLNKASILAEVEMLTDKYESFAQIIGMMVYLALILDERRNLLLWSLLLEQGEHWQRTIFDSFYQMSEELCNAGVFDALLEMLNSRDKGVQTQALEILKRRTVAQAAPASVVSAVCRSAESTSIPVQRRAVLALGGMPDKTTEAPSVLSVLIQAVDDPRQEIRINAVTSLGKLGNTEVVEEFIGTLVKKVLIDDAKIVRQRTAVVLGKLRHTSAVFPLIEALDDKDPGVRWRAAEALGRLEDVQAVSPLIDALEDLNWEVRREVATALGQIGDARAVGPLTDALGDDDQEVRREAATALGQIGDTRAVEPLTDALSDDDQEVRREAATALGQIGDARAVESLRATLSDSVQEVRERAAEALGRMGDTRAVEALIAALDDGAQEVRRRIAETLGQLGDTRAVESLIAALKDSDAFVRREVTEALGKLKDKRALVSLMASLKDSNYEVRLSAAEALGKLGDTGALKPLIAALGDSHEEVRLCATRSLGQIWELPALTQFGSKSWEERLKAAETLGELGEPRLVGPLIAGLNDSHPQVQSAVAEALGKMGKPAMRPLIAALRDSNEQLRSGAAKALGELGDTRVVEPLIGALKDSKASVRKEVAEALGRLGGPRTVQVLLKALRDSNRTVRSTAARALGNLGEPAVDSLIAALKNNDQRVRSGAAKALGKAVGELQNERAMEALVDIIEDGDALVRRAVVEALGWVKGTQAVASLTNALKDIDWRVRLGAVEALGRLRDAKVIEPIIAALKDDNLQVWSAAAEALGDLGESAVIPLIAVLRSESGQEGVRLGVTRALGQIRRSPALIELGSNDWMTRLRGAEALRQQGETWTSPLLRAALRDSQEEVRLCATQSLGEIWGMPALIQLGSSSWRARALAAKELGESGDVQAVEPLILALADASSEVQHAAAEALRCIGTPEALQAVQQHEGPKSNDD
jgi:HEAT repeat protein